MFTDLKPYGEYQETGVPWNGEAPAHWSVVPSRSVFRLKRSIVGAASCDYTLLSLTKRGVIPRDMENPEGKFPDSFDTYQEVDPGDLVFCLFDIDETPRTIGISNEHGMITGAYTCFRVNNQNDSNYIAAYFVSLDDRKALKPLYTGLRKVIKTSTLLSARIPLPPLDEQAAIVMYLGHATARIDRAIAAKRRLIALLEEQKLAMINQAVTRGLDPDAPMRDSGIPWLGTIPAHWSVKRNKWLFHETNTRSSTGTELLFSLRMRQGLVPHNDVAAVPIPNESLVGYKHVKTGQVVMNRMRAAIGLFGLAESSGLVSPDYATLTPTAEVDPRYFMSLFKTRCAMAEFRRRSTGLGTGSSGFMRLYSEKFGDISMPLPTIQEQGSIISFLSENLPSDDMITRVNREIELLREFKTRLTADVVTGQVDIRAAAARLPEVDPADLVSEVSEQDEDDLDAELAGSLEAVDA